MIETSPIDKPVCHVEHADKIIAFDTPEELAVFLFAKQLSLSQVTVRVRSFLFGDGSTTFAPIFVCDCNCASTMTSRIKSELRIAAQRN